MSLFIFSSATGGGPALAQSWGTRGSFQGDSGTQNASERISTMFCSYLIARLLEEGVRFVAKARFIVLTIMKVDGFV